MDTNLLKIVLLLVFISFNNLVSKDQKFHIVKKGETLYSISKAYNLNIEKLKELNNLESNEISIGQQVILDDDNKEIIDTTNKDIKTSRIEGFASSINDSVDSDKYLALHKSAEVGTIIFVKNQMNENIVIVRVIGKLPNTGINDKIDIRLSSIAYEKLNAKDDIIPVELSYVGKEIK
jgi:rare lipoprotein A (peptidoglycan hydrolase)